MPRIQSVSIRLQKDWRGASERGIVELNTHAWVAPLFDLVIVEGKASHVNKRAKASQLRGNWSSLILFGSFVFRISLWWIWMIWYPVQAASCFDGAALMIKHVCGFKIMRRFSYFSDSKAPHYHWNFKSLTRNKLGIFTGHQEKVTLSWKTGFRKEVLFAGQGSKKGVSLHPPIPPLPTYFF